MQRDLWLKKQDDKKAKREANQAARAKRSPQEQLAVLDAKLGKDQGAVRERARLQMLIETSKKISATKQRKEKK